MKKVLYCVIVLAALISSLGATPIQTLGMLRTPDAYILPHKAAEFLLVGYYRDVARPIRVEYKGFTPYVMAGVGLLDRIEISVFAGDKVKDDMVYYLNLKGKIIPESTRIPQIAVGIDNLFSPVPRHSIADLEPGEAFYTHPDAHGYEYYSPYIVASKQSLIVGVPFMFNGGVGTNRFIGQVRRSRIFNGIFASAEFSPFRNFTFQGEYAGHDFNAGIKYVWKDFGFRFGMEALEDLAKDNGYEDNLRMAFGVSYLFDKYAETQRRPDLRQFATSDILEEPIIVQTPTPDQPGLVIPPSDTTIPGSDVTTGPTTGTETPPELVVVTPGTVLQTPGLVTGGSSVYSQLSPDVRDLLEELRVLREERQKAQKSLEDLRSWIQELKKPKN
ncbi:MAG TPA: hypothetical protein PL188_10215 [Candidatus Cloacimonadota bacterium]|nr:hypothetical protein [Candidatus Cloacimonadota bacterium]